MSKIKSNLYEIMSNRFWKQYLKHLVTVADYDIKKWNKYIQRWGINIKWKYTYFNILIDIIDIDNLYFEFIDDNDTRLTKDFKENKYCSIKLN